jgi:hypothetical protein
VEIRPPTIQTILIEKGTTTTKRPVIQEPLEFTKSKLVSYYSSTKKPSKDDEFSLANVFSYLFTPDNDNDNDNSNAMDINTLLTDNYQEFHPPAVAPVIPPFKNINITVPKWDNIFLKGSNNSTLNNTYASLTSLYNQTPAMQTTTIPPSNYAASKASMLNTFIYSSFPRTSTQRPTPFATSTTEFFTNAVTHQIAPVTLKSTQPLEKIIYPEQYVLTPKDIETMKKHHSDRLMEIHAKPTSPKSNGLLKLAGCNIYGETYMVGKIIPELSNPCPENKQIYARLRPNAQYKICECTGIGVSCVPLTC